MAERPDLSFDQVAPAYRAFIDDYLIQKGFDPARFCAQPLPGQDEMFFNAILPNYEQDVSISAFKFVESTLRLEDCYRQIVEGVFGGYDRLGSVLDFASGWGRLTRVLEQRLDPSQIFVSDIYHQAVAWQGETFGVTPIPSTKDPATFEYTQAHDLVFVGSMFSHLPEPLFHAWLAKLYGLTAPGGVLAFTVHDESFLPEGQAADPSGITFLRFSESGSLELDIYGMSYVSEAFVGAAIARLAPGLSWRRYPKGVYENQDLYVVGAAGVDLSTLVVASSPMGGLEAITHLPTGELELSGWVLERTPGETIERVRLTLAGETVSEVEPQTDRPEILRHFPKAANAPRGWRVRLAPEQARAGAMIRAGFESTSGLIGYAYVQVPGPAAMTYSGWSRRGLRGG